MTPVKGILPTVTAAVTLVRVISPTVTATVTLVRVISTTVTATVTPVKAILTTVTATVTPVKAILTTVTAIVTPVKVILTTVMATVTPVKVISTTVTATMTPVRFISTTVTATVTPVKVISPTVTVTVTPVRGHLDDRPGDRDSSQSPLDDRHRSRTLALPSAFLPWFRSRNRDPSHGQRAEVYIDQQLQHLRQEMAEQLAKVDQRQDTLGMGVRRFDAFSIELLGQVRLVVESLANITQQLKRYDDGVARERDEISAFALNRTS